MIMQEKPGSQQPYGSYPRLRHPSFASRVSLPEFRFGITGNRRFSGSCTASATARGPFRSLRFAQED